MNWEIVVVKYGMEERYLKEGWEPFSVSPHDTSYQFLNTTSQRYETQHEATDYIYLRRKSC